MLFKFWQHMLPARFTVLRNVRAWRKVVKIPQFEQY
jgi:hypothetical protein